MPDYCQGIRDVLQAVSAFHRETEQEDICPRVGEGPQPGVVLSLSVESVELKPTAMEILTSTSTFPPQGQLGSLE